MTDTPKLRGFAAINAKDPELARQIASRGGKSVNPANRSFSQDRELAVEAGRRGGLAKRSEAGQ